MRFEALDSWRGIAATLVALVHLTATGHFYDWPFVRNGGIGVPLFFVLSGFVITHAYGDRISSKPALGKFLIRRFGRIYPLHLFTLSILLVLELAKLALVVAGLPSGQPPFEGTNSIGSLLANIFLLNAIVPQGAYTWNGPSWSISTEFFAYLVFSVLTIVLSKNVKIAAIVLWPILAITLFAIDNHTPPIHNTSGRGLALCMLGFYSGGIAHQLFVHIKKKSITLGTPYEIGAAALALAIFWYNPFNSIATVISFAIVVLVFAFDGGLLSKILKTKIPTLLGKLSYSIYLVHFVILSILNGALRGAQSILKIKLLDPTSSSINFASPVMMDFFALLYLLVVIGIAAITYHYVEVPGRSYFNRVSDRFQASQAGHNPAPTAP